jgi:hypothetical protein
METKKHHQHIGEDEDGAGSISFTASASSSLTTVISRSPLLSSHQYLDSVLLKPAPVQKMKRRRSRPASPNSFPCFVAGTARDRARAVAAAAGRVDSDEGARADDVLGMAD